MRTPSRTTRLLPVVAALAVAVGACSESRPAAPTPLTAGQLQERPSLPGPNIGAPDVEFFEVCKEYTSGSGPDVVFMVAVDIDSNGSTDQSFQTTLGAGECEDVWVRGGIPTYDRVTVTEVAPVGYTTSYVKSTVVGTTVTSDPAVSNTTVSGQVRGDTGVAVVFTNTAESVPAEGRFTGGGFQMVSNGVDVKVTRGFTVHCHNLLTNNLEVNWDGNRFHMDKNSLSNVSCTFTQDPSPPRAPVSRIVASSTGQCNGAPATIDFVLEDRGEPGRNDRAALRISGGCSLDVPEDFLDRGNIQAHFDQPHR